MIKNRSYLLGLLAVMFVCFGTVHAHWVPEDGHKMHFPQTPGDFSWDICMNDIALADDFQCSETGAITDIHFWISWKDNIVSEAIRWNVWIYSDNEGKPGVPLWRFKEGKIAYRMEEPMPQGWLCPVKPEILPDNHKAWALVNITEIVEPFEQVEGKVYWLVLHASMPIYKENTQLISPPHVGWKTAGNHWRSPMLWSKWPVTTTDMEWQGMPLNTLIDGAFVINGPEAPPVRLWDFGDAPEIDPRIMDPIAEDSGSSGSGSGSAPIVWPTFDYPTTLERDGARHLYNPSVFLGNPLTDNIQIDTEPDGLPNLAASGDDNNQVDDEEGVIFPEFLWEEQDAKLVIWASVNNGYLNAWIDYNADGDWDDAGERIFAGEPLVSGENVRVISVPNAYHGDARSYYTYARFRFSLEEKLSYRGPAGSGEVEDYRILIQNVGEPKLDFGDAPEVTVPEDGSLISLFPTTLARDGARHKIVNSIRLGRAIDGELDGQPSLDALGDDNADVDDEDGVYFVTPLMAGEEAKLKVIASADGFLNGWIDFNLNGKWDTNVEQVFADQKLIPGVNELVISVPLLTNSNFGPAFSRFRFSSQEGLSFTGLAENGEVEDYLVKIVPPQPDLDFGDAPEWRCDDPSVARCNSYPTTLARNGARHIIHPEIHLGELIDQEANGQPTNPADGDDLAGLDDEDGVKFVTPLIPGFPAKIAVSASTEGKLDAWIDFNADGDWDDDGEQIFASEALNAGVNGLEINVPDYPDAVPSDRPTYARFRFSTTGNLTCAGLARDGEVEDYMVKIVEAPERAADLGDAPDSTNTFGQQMFAYPSQGMLTVMVPANYPTVYRKGSPPFGPIHRNPEKIAFLGEGVSLEQEADYGFDEDGVNNIVPLKDAKDLDKADDGIQVPLVLPQNRPTRFDYLVTVVEPARLLFVNAWFDWNRDGDWDDIINAGRPNDTTDHRGWAPEWAVRNQVLWCLEPGVHSITSPWFISHHPDVLADGTSYPIWIRITLSERPWEPCITPNSIKGIGGSGPAKGYWIGETEDYYFRPIVKRPQHADLDADDRITLEDFALFVEQWLTEPTE